MASSNITEAPVCLNWCANSSNTTYTKIELSIIISIFSMTVGIVSNSLALAILVKAYRHFKLKSKASFLLFASGLVITDFLGHLINGSIVMLVYSLHKDWDTFDPQKILCGFFGACMVFFGLSPLLLGSVMAVERCIGVTNPIFHSTKLTSRHMKKLLALVWLFAIFIAVLPIMAKRPYEVQESKSWCFFKIKNKRDWVDVFFPLLFSTLGLASLFISILCNTVTGVTLIRSKMRSEKHRQGRSHHFEMICQLLAIMLVSCICWGPLLVIVKIGSTDSQNNVSCEKLLLAVRMATWNQILDPWVYILLRKAVLKKLFIITRRCCGYKILNLYKWNCSSMKCSMKMTAMSSQPGLVPESSIRSVMPVTVTSGTVPCT
ncbi:prostaglandin F2-alpha receptor-like [Polyodon spathula]|uniref:prostaglandin F2-alpha receptor-like n=1 Tax=Polyodon spathula TaxID=7913 RepID=UPI001B7EA0C6|nr:prostaglandin F2-alpha receptor-like [Polyodon spathula]